VKIFGDGSVAAKTSLLLEPYEGDPDFYGDANMTVDGFAESFIKFDTMGVGVHMHVIGDGTSERVVQAFEIMKEINGDTGTHHKMAHNFMTTKDQLERIAAMKDVNVDFSPPAFHPHAAAESAFRPPIGERMEQTMAVKTALEAGLNVDYGSDWLTLNPTPNPFIAIESLVTRENPFDPDMAGTINAENAITLEQVIDVVTLQGAYVLGVEDILGSIEVGKFADMIVLDQNLFEIDADQIYGTNVLQTILGGNVVYDRSEQGNEDTEDVDDLPRSLVR
jgi:predicted amidohydrolase YtcJ